LAFLEKRPKAWLFLIARAISKRGTEGAKMFTGTFTKNEAAVERILGMIPADIIREVNK
jgi:hypothetical protein